ncbi:MAG: hypothetical protein JWR14_4319 [Caballeronia sp.]|jgi:hypothetical protein|nr:hypothetical protein [Caballeronia sp.]
MDVSVARHCIPCNISQLKLLSHQLTSRGSPSLLQANRFANAVMSPQ